MLKFFIHRDYRSLNFYCSMLIECRKVFFSTYFRNLSITFTKFLKNCFFLIESKRKWWLDAIHRKIGEINLPTFYIVSSFMLFIKNRKMNIMPLGLAHVLRIIILITKSAVNLPSNMSMIGNLTHILFFFKDLCSCCVEDGI